MTFVSTGGLAVCGRGAGPEVWVKIGQVGGWAALPSVGRQGLLARSLFGLVWVNVSAGSLKKTKLGRQKLN